MNRYGLYYLLFYGFIAVPFSFLPLALADWGISKEGIGIISVLTNVAGTLGAPIALHVAHHYRSSRKPLAFFALLSFAFFIPLLVFQTLFAVSVILFAHYFCYRGCGGIIDAIAVRRSFETDFHFEHARLWGSVGFIIVSAMLGLLIDFRGSSVIVPCGAILLAALVVMSVKIDSAGTGHQKNNGGKPAKPPLDQNEKAWHVPFLLLILANGLGWASGAVMSIYLSVYLEALNWSGTWIAVAFNVGVIAEIALFLIFPSIQSRFSLKTVFQFSLLMCVLRWVIMAVTQDPAAILFAQALHGFTFGTLYIAATKLVFTILPDQFRDRGQGWMILGGSGLGLTLGKVSATWGASTIPDLLALPQLFAYCALAGAFGLLISFFIRDERI